MSSARKAALFASMTGFQHAVNHTVNVTTVQQFRSRRLQSSVFGVRAGAIRLTEPLSKAGQGNIRCFFYCQTSYSPPCGIVEMGRNVQTYILKQKGNFIIGEIDWGPHQDHIAAGTAGSAGMACLHFVVQSGKQLRPLWEIVSAVVAETDQHPPRSG